MNAPSAKRGQEDSDTMSSTTKVRRDDKGLYVRAGGYVFRPGPINGYGHAHDMSDAGLAEGTQVKASHFAGTPTGRIRLADGRKLLWADDYMHAQEAARLAARQPEAGDASCGPQPGPEDAGGCGLPGRR